tara:strand:+ start:2564 stop:2803 length:240 start_codon:yes stop_codon:yes gene_type:complete
VHTAPTPSPSTDNTSQENEPTYRVIPDEIIDDPRVHIEDIPRFETPVHVTVDPLGGGLLSLTSQHLGQACPWLKSLGLG